MNSAESESPSSLLPRLLEAVETAPSASAALAIAAKRLADFDGMSVSFQSDPSPESFPCGPHQWLRAQGASPEGLAMVRCIAVLLRARANGERGASHTHALAVVSAGLAHELNNPLAAVLANLELATRQVGDALRKSATYSWLDDLHGELDDARIAADRLHGVVKNLKVLGHITSTRGVVELQRVLDTCVQLVGRGLRQRGRFHQTAYENHAIAAPPHTCTHALLACLLRAMQVLPRGDGTASLTLVTIEPPQSRQGGTFVSVELQYEGPAVRLSSTALLAAAHDLAVAIGGEMTETATPEGATWVVRLPISTGSPLPAIDRQTSNVARVLVIDDQPLIGKIVARMLSEHDVHTEVDPVIGIARATNEVWDIVLIDAQFADAFASAVQQITAHTVVTSASPRPNAGEQCTMMKPFDLRELRRVVKQSMPKQRR